MVAKTKKQLGRGLSELFGDVQEESVQSQGQLKLKVDQLKPGKFQPRHIFDSGKLDSLIQSISEKGVLQPIIVRKSDSDLFEIIAGERRWRASQAVGLKEIPVVITQMSDEEALETGIIENIQRDDLTPIEEAKAYQKLIDEFSYSQEQLSKRIGKSRSYIANILRLLTLPEVVQSYVAQGKLSAGHARTLIGYEDAETVADKILKKGMNVRQLESYMNQLKNGSEPANTNSNYDDPDKVSIERQLSQLLGYKTKLKVSSKGSGEIIISFSSMEDVDSIMQSVMKMQGYAA